MHTVEETEVAQGAEVGVIEEGKEIETEGEREITGTEIGIGIGIGIGIETVTGIMIEEEKEAVKKEEIMMAITAETETGKEKGTIVSNFLPHTSFFYHQRVRESFQTVTDNFVLNIEY